LAPFRRPKQRSRTAGLRLNDVDVIELNEPFAVQVLVVMQEWNLTNAGRDRINVHGSGVSLGHPVGATGARMLLPCRVSCTVARLAMD
jgi:acetyl-CoA acetyltransferase